MPYHSERVIAVDVHGTTSTKFTSVIYRVDVHTRGETGPDAKKKAEPSIEAIKRCLLQHAKEGEIEMDRLKTSFAVDTHTNRTTGDFAGYKAQYTVSFKGKNVAHATTLHDALTSIVGVESPTPRFAVDESNERFAEAFADAVSKAEIRFKAQCDALNFDPSVFSLVSWTVSEGESHSGKFMSLYSPQLSTDYLELPDGTPVIEPGKATHDLRVTFIYERLPLAE